MLKGKTALVTGSTPRISVRLAMTLSPQEHGVAPPQSAAETEATKATPSRTEMRSQTETGRVLR